MDEAVASEARWIRFRAWSGMKMRAQAPGGPHFLISLGLELKWRRLRYIKFRNDENEFWTAIIHDGVFLLRPAKGEPVTLRSHSLRYMGWGDRVDPGRWHSRWSPETGLFEHTAISAGDVAAGTVTPGAVAGGAARPNALPDPSASPIET